MSPAPSSFNFLSRMTVATFLILCLAFSTAVAQNNPGVDGTPAPESSLPVNGVTGSPPPIFEQSPAPTPFTDLSPSPSSAPVIIPGSGPSVSPFEQNTTIMVHSNPEKHSQVKFFLQKIDPKTNDKRSELAKIGETDIIYTLEPGIYTIEVRKDTDFFHYWYAEDSVELKSSIPCDISPEQHRFVRWERVIAVAVSAFLLIGSLAAYYVAKFIKVKDREVKMAKTALTKFQTTASTRGFSTQGIPVEGVTGQIERFAVLEKIGQGGFASVYKVADEHGDIYALKVPHYHIFDIPEYKTRFKREAEIIKGLHHPGIVRMYDYSLGENYTIPYICFEFVTGTSLKSVIERNRVLPIKRIVRIITDIAEALEYAHAKGIVHRDIKPENVMLSKRNEVKVMDLGIARSTGAATLTSTGATLGTPFYIAPEQIESSEVDGRADLYSLGVLLYEMLTGHLPFFAETAVNVILMHLNEAPKPPSSFNIPIPAELEGIVLKLMEKKPEHRFHTARELIDALKPFL